MQLFIVKDYVRLRITDYGDVRLTQSSYSLCYILTAPAQRESFYLHYFWTIDAFSLATILN